MSAAAPRVESGGAAGPADPPTLAGFGHAARDGRRPGIEELAADLEAPLGYRVFVELRVAPEEISGTTLTCCGR